MFVLKMQSVIQFPKRYSCNIVAITLASPATVCSIFYNSRHLLEHLHPSTSSRPTQSK